MFKCFYPQRTAQSAYTVDYAEFYRQGFRGIIFDIDNTLVEHNAPANEAAEQLVKGLKEMGFGVCVVSNNKEERVKSFCEVIGAEYVFKARKPKSEGYQKAMTIMNTDTTDTFAVGDQIFTDTWGANRAGVCSVLVKQLGKKEEIQIILKRRLEKPILWFYRRKCKKEGIKPNL